MSTDALIKPQERQAKPKWLRVKLPTGKKYTELRGLVDKYNLNTICTSGSCPNMGECWGEGTATFMILGNICTRSCGFCGVKTGRPESVDWDEPEKVARSIKIMGIKHAVITSVDRDDLKDGGAEHFSDTVKAIKEKAPQVLVEALVPDFLGNKLSIETLLNSQLEVFAQNLETVKRLTKKVRDPRAGYRQTLDVLSYAKEYSPSVITKSSLMLGLGETEQEITSSFLDLRNAGVDVLTLGQYMRPTINHLPVEKWYSPEEFKYFERLANEVGFLEVASGPMVRSSYRADKIAHLIKD